MADKLEALDPGMEELEHQFQEVLTGLSVDKSLEKFRDEYEKVYNALRKSHENERKLVKKVRELDNEIVSNAAKVQQALRLSEEDAATIEELKKQVERAWGMVESANSKEEAASQTIERLETEIGHLKGLIEKHTALLGGDTTLEELITARDTLAIKLREADQQVEYERERADGLSKEVAARIEKYRGKKAHAKELERQLASKSAEEVLEAKRKSTLEAEIARLKEQLAERSDELDSAHRKHEEALENVRKLTAQSQQQQFTLNNTLTELHKLTQAQSRHDENTRDRLLQIDALNETRTNLEKELRAAKHEIEREKSNASRLKSQVEIEKRERERTQDGLNRAEQDILKLKGELTTVQKELEGELLRYKGAERQVAKLDKEKSAAEKKAATEQHRVGEARADVASKVSEISLLEAESRKLLLEQQKMRSVITLLEGERDKLEGQIETVQSRVKEAQEEVRMREAQIAEQEKREAELSAKVKQSQAMYDSMRAERNQVSKALMEAQDEIGELKRKTKVQGNQITTLKEDVHAKDKALVAEQFEHQSVEKRLEQRNHEVVALKRLLEEANINVSKQDAEIRDLNLTIRRLDSEALAQKRAYDTVVTERDILSTQIVRRNDELALLKERMVLMQTSLSTGELAYKERAEDIRLLKLKVSSLSRELNVALANAGSSDSLKREVVRLQRELMSEQTKTKALSEELENPMNVHRWRKLEGVDPATFELLQKIQTLQRRLIAKTEEVVEKDTLLAEKERELDEVRKALERAPGADITEQLTTAQSALTLRTRQLKSLASEVNMYHTQIEEYKFEVERVSRELLETKKAYYESRRSAGGTGWSKGGDSGASFRARAEEAQKTLAATAHPKVVGGGFVAS